MIYRGSVLTPGQLDFQDFGLSSSGSRLRRVCVLRPRNCHPSVRHSKRSFLIKGFKGQHGLFSRYDRLVVCFSTGSRNAKNCQDGSPRDRSLYILYRWSKMRWHRGYCWRQGWALSDRLTLCQDLNIFLLVPSIERHFSHTSALGRPLQVERVTLSLCSSLAHCRSSKTWKGRPCGHKYAQIIGKYGHHVVISDWIDSDRHVCRAPISVSI